MQSTKIFFEEFVADVRGWMKELYRWLDLDPAPAHGLDLHRSFRSSCPAIGRSER
jgi:hypothetical protein